MKKQQKADSRQPVLALTSRGAEEAAREVLRDVGIYRTTERDVGHYEMAIVRAGRKLVPMIRSTNGDSELLGEIAKQLVIAGIEFTAVQAG